MAGMGDWGGGGRSCARERDAEIEAQCWKPEKGLMQYEVRAQICTERV
jgi:hypothetical protein